MAVCELIVLAGTEGKLGNLLYLQVKLHSLNIVLPFCGAAKCIDETLTSSTTTVNDALPFSHDELSAWTVSSGYKKNNEEGNRDEL